MACGVGKGGKGEGEGMGEEGEKKGGRGVVGGTTIDEHRGWPAG